MAPMVTGPWPLARKFDGSLVPTFHPLSSARFFGTAMSSGPSAARSPLTERILRNWGRVARSVPSTWLGEPSMLPNPPSMPPADATPGTVRMVSRASRGRAGWPGLACESTMRSAVKALSRALFTVVLMDWMRMAKVTMSPTPIISAEAVAAVRRGLRMAFSPASLPVKAKRTGAPMMRLMGLANSGPTTITPRNTMAMPRPTSCRLSAEKSPR